MGNRVLGVGTSATAVLSTCTGGMEKFSAKQNFRKTLKVSHFCLGFFPNENNNEIKHSQRVLLNFLDPDLENTSEIL